MSGVARFGLLKQVFGFSRVWMINLNIQIFTTCSLIWTNLFKGRFNMYIVKSLSYNFPSHSCLSASNWNKTEISCSVSSVLSGIGARHRIEPIFALAIINFTANYHWFKKVFFYNCSSVLHPSSSVTHLIPMCTDAHAWRIQCCLIIWLLDLRVLVFLVPIKFGVIYTTSYFLIIRFRDRSMVYLWF